MAAFDFFITLDGNNLNGFEGLCGVARLRCGNAVPLELALEVAKR